MTESVATYNILIVEDNVSDAKIVGRILSRQSDFAVRTYIVTSLKFALEVLEKNEHMVILLDLSLPDASGLDAVIKLTSEFPDIPIVILTGFKDEKVALEAVQKGAQDYLVKGEFDEKLLIRVLRYAVERNKMKQTIQSLSLLDELTGVYNRRGFFVLVEQQLKLAQRKKMGTLFFLADMDHLKVINDTFGHFEGDYAIRQVADILKSSFRRQSDIVGRIGGDEFVMAALDSQDRESTFLIQSVKENLKKYNEHSNRDYKLSLSIGSAYWDPSQPSSIENLMIQADMALYNVKKLR